MTKKRLDQLILEFGFARSRSHSQQLIRESKVEVDGKTVTDPSKAFSPSPDLKSKITVASDSKYVSRGAYKLIGALQHTGLKIDNMTCLDIGISTGGFTQVLLEYGSKFVEGVDVGHQQLSLALASHPQVRIHEGMNARNIKKSDFTTKFDLIVMDVSFISISLILPVLPPLLQNDGKVLALVKPQFELGRAALNKKGIVDSPQLLESLRPKIKALFQSHDFIVVDYFESSIKGGDGNTEYFCYASKKSET